MQTKHLVTIGAALLFAALLSTLLPAREINFAAQIVSQGPPRGEILNRVPQLQKVAWEANRGMRGCGTAKIKLSTSKGDVEITCGLDPFHVFGPKVDVAQVLTLLRSRAYSNSTGSTGPMSGDVTDLGYVCFSVLQLANDPDAIPVAATLLTDKDGHFRSGAVNTLIALGNSDPKSPRLIQEVKFPKEYAPRGNRRPAHIPEWASFDE